MTGAEWFEGSKAGLERIARRRGLAYVLFELVQNAWDTGAKHVDVTFEPVAGKPLVDVFVQDDDPEGFRDITHAWTLFAESDKKKDPEKRGRFNFGEKLVLSICESAEITTIKGKVTFDADGRIFKKKGGRESGTVFRGRVRMTREELAEVPSASEILIPPLGVTTSIAAPGLRQILQPVLAVASFETSLKTEVADEGGFLREVERRTKVTVHQVLPGQPGRLYEMGIPVCDTGDPWNVNVHQKVPVNLERNSVSRAYLRAIRVHVLNATFNELADSAATATGVLEAIADKRVSAEALEHVITAQFGSKRAIGDPSDREAERRLKAEGYAIIHGRSLSPEVFDNIRTHKTVLPAGQISPSYNPYSDNPNGQAPGSLA